MTTGAALPDKYPLIFTLRLPLDRHLHLCYTLITMLRTQIYLPQETHQELTLWARKMNLPMAEVVRRIIKTGLKKKEEFLEKGNDILDLTKLKIRGGPKNLSQKLDFYLYQ